MLVSYRRTPNRLGRAIDVDGRQALRHLQVLTHRAGVECLSVPMRSDRVLLVSTIFDSDDVDSQIGGDAYSYYFVYRAFKPLLEQYCEVREVKRPESRGRIDLAVDL